MNRMRSVSTWVGGFEVCEAGRAAETGRGRVVEIAVSWRYLCVHFEYRAAMPDVGLHAFIDEAGQRARSAKSSDHFIMSAVIVPDESLADAAAVLAQLRADLARRPGDVLHWRNIKSHSQRLRIVQTFRDQSWLTISAVVVCKNHLTGPALDDDTAYLYTLRYLLERLSWLARDQRRVLAYTLSHIVRFKIAKLRAYEELLRGSPGVQVAWGWLDPKGGRIDQPNPWSENARAAYPWVAAL